MTFPKKRWIIVKILGISLLYFPLFFQASSAQNDLYLVHTASGAPGDPGYLYKLDYQTCELIEVVHLRIEDHVQFKSDWADIAFHPNGELFFIEGGGRVFLIDTISGELEFYFQFENTPYSYLPGLAIDFKGNFYAIGGYWGDIYIYYPETGEQYRSEPTLNAPAGLDLTFFNREIHFHSVANPRIIKKTDLMGNSQAESIMEIGIVSFGGMSTYADSCSSHYMIGLPSRVWNVNFHLDPVYKVHPQNLSIEGFCDSLYPEPSIGFGAVGASHRYENLASMPAVELQSHDYDLEYPDECNPTTAYLTVTASGGIDDILYALNDNNFSRDSVFYLDEPGWYEIIAKDSRSCFWTDSFYFDPQPALVIESIVVSNPVCEEHPSGEVHVFASGGNKPLEYALNQSGFSSENHWSGLIAGEYAIEVRDSMGCLADTTLILIPENPPEPDFSVQDEYCRASDGEISIALSDSLQGFSFRLNGGDFQSESVFTGLSADTYTVSLRDSVGCEYDHTVEIDRISDLLVSMVYDTSCMYNAPAVDSIFLTSYLGCDSLVIAHREPGEYIVEHLTTYDCEATTAYTDTVLIESALDCDTLQITNYLPAESDWVEIARDSCSFEAIPDQTQHYVNQYGCDSTVTLIYQQLMPDLVLMDSIHCDPPHRDSLFFVNALGCDSLVVIDYFQATPAVDLGPDRSVPEGSEVVLQPSTQADIAHFNWNPTDYLDDPLLFQPVARPEESILYTLEITDIHGCTASDQIRITLVEEELALYIPNAFSPNADGINDYFTAYFLDDRYRIQQLSIWDRWGTRIFHCTNHPCHWDGTNGGEWAAGGIYVFEFLLLSEGGEQLIRRGEVLLVR
nr:gliding motility-associated C-terminal domain-containing protein [Saprospiraceae bacterium]